MSSNSQPGACPNCYARVTYGEKHAWGCPLAPAVPPEMAERMARQKADFEVKEVVAEEHF